VSDAHFFPGLEHQLREMLDPFFEQEQLVAIAMEPGLRNAQGALRKARHAFQHGIQA
jgi:hypothetical protein